MLRSSLAVASLLICAAAGCTAQPTETIEPAEDIEPIGRAESAQTSTVANVGTVVTPVSPVHPSIDPRIFQINAQCGDTPLSTTPIAYSPGQRPWVADASRTVLVELAPHGDQHDIVGVLMPTDGAPPTYLGRVRVSEAHYACFVASYGARLVYFVELDPLDAMQLLFGGNVSYVHAHYDPQHGPSTNSCVTRIMPPGGGIPGGGGTGSNGAKWYPNACVPSAVTGYALIGWMHGQSTANLGCTSCPPLPRVFTRLPREILVLP